MAESKNNFLKARMNKDLDDRLIPPGEYRDAKNITISKSEGQDVGTVQTVLGNILISDFGYTDCNVKIVATYINENSQELYVFLTDYNDLDNALSNNYSFDAINAIWRFNIQNGELVKLVEGSFLNFSINSNFEIDLIEDLLFWTDNRNQPRKINVVLANPNKVTNPTYYTNEDQISVAKYYPFTPIELTKETVTSLSRTVGGSGFDEYIGTTIAAENISGRGCGMVIEITSDGGPPDYPLGGFEIVDFGQNYRNGDVIELDTGGIPAQLTVNAIVESTMRDTCTEFLPNYYEQAYAGAPIATVTTATAVNMAPTPPESFLEGTLVKIVSSAGLDKTPVPGATTLSSTGPTNITLSWDTDITASFALDTTDIIYIGINPFYQENWPGDCEYLKDKFVRFAYRFKFDDGEYSLISPFTQECFVPRQDGYFLEGDEERALDSTELEFFENKITDIDLIIPCPTYLDSASGWEDITEKMHVKSIEIIYKEASESTLKVVDEIEIENINFECTGTLNLIYNYQSRAPYRVLPESELTRVSDVVPIKAKTQSTVGNRIIYGNYLNKHTSPTTLNYTTGVDSKLVNSGANYLRSEYQNHTVKQNRNYQVGFVLSDRYGRQSDVILSSVDQDGIEVGETSFGGSTFFHKFQSEERNVNLITNLDTWPGDSIKLLVNEQIPSSLPISGYPGLFSDALDSDVENFYGGEGYPTGGSAYLNVPTTGGSGSGMELNVVTGSYSNPSDTSLRLGAIFPISDPGSGYVNGDVITVDPAYPGFSPTSDASFTYFVSKIPNVLGWHSYKIVVKQNEQEYYNVYLPSILNGEVTLNVTQSATRSVITLFSDNINKVPKDLTDVGPNQLQFRSNENLNFRVSNNNTAPYNSQYYPSQNSSDKVTLIGTMNDLKIARPISRSYTTSAAPATLGTVIIDDTLETASEYISVGCSVTANDDGGAWVSGLSPTDNVLVKAVAGNATAGETLVLLMNADGVTFDSGVYPWVAGDMFNFEAPAFIYNSKTNPYLGILNTKSQLGVNFDDSLVQALTVAETEPVVSNLNIFWETSTSDLVSNLNNAIALNQIGPSGITPIFFNLSEDDPTGTRCTNDFQPRNSDNSVVTDTNATAYIISIIDGNNINRDSDFQIVSNGDGTFYLRNTTTFTVGNDPNSISFNINIGINTNGIVVTSSIEGFITNVAPQWINQPPVGASGLPEIYYTTPGFENNLSEIQYITQFEFENGSINANNKHNDLTIRIDKVRVPISTSADQSTFKQDGTFVGTYEPNPTGLKEQMERFGNCYVQDQEASFDNIISKFLYYYTCQEPGYCGNWIGWLTDTTTTTEIGIETTCSTNDTEYVTIHPISNNSNGRVQWVSMPGVFINYSKDGINWDIKGYGCFDVDFTIIDGGGLSTSYTYRLYACNEFAGGGSVSPGFWGYACTVMDPNFITN